MAVTDEVDPLDTRCAVGDAGAREQRVHVPAALVDGSVDRRRVGEIEMNCFHPGQRDLGEVHHHDLGPGVPDELGRRRAHAAGAADDERALAVVPEGVEERHVTPVSL